MSLTTADIDQIRGLLREANSTTEPKGSMTIESNSKGNNYSVHLYTSDTPTEIKELINKTIKARIDLEAKHEEEVKKREQAKLAAALKEQEESEAEIDK